MSIERQLIKNWSHTLSISQKKRITSAKIYYYLACTSLHILIFFPYKHSVLISVKRQTDWLNRKESSEVVMCTICCMFLLPAHDTSTALAYLLMYRKHLCTMRYNAYTIIFFSFLFLQFSLLLHNNWNKYFVFLQTYLYHSWIASSSYFFILLVSWSNREQILFCYCFWRKLVGISLIIFAFFFNHYHIIF